MKNMAKDDRKPPFLIERNPGSFEYQLPISLKMVIDYCGKIPLLKNERDEWELPGGKLEVDETPEECVCREISEELNINISNVDIIDSWVYKITPIRHVFIVSYGTIYRGNEKLRLSAEHRDLGVFEYDKIDKLKMPAAYKFTIARWGATLSTLGLVSQ
jgi:8-oxo-dGTP pyrophosphatase MutT (NUDIX family)